MFHTSTSGMLAYWNAIKGDAAAPLRTNVNPADFRQVLTQIFMLGRLGPGDYRFRLAGALLNELHGGELRGREICSLFLRDEQLGLKSTLESMRATPEPVVVTATAHAGDRSAQVEILLAPLADQRGEIDRVLGLYQPLTPLATLRDDPIDHLTISRVTKAIDASPAPRLRLAAVGGRLVG